VFVLCLCLCNVCVCVRVFVYVLICLSVLVLVSFCVRLCLRLCACSDVRWCVCQYVCASVYVRECVCMSVHFGGCRCGFEFSKVSTKSNVRACANMNILHECVCIYVHISAYTLGNIHTYIHARMIKRGTNTITYSHTLTQLTPIPTLTLTVTNTLVLALTLTPSPSCFSISRTHKSHILHPNTNMNVWREREIQLLACWICPLVCVCACGDSMYVSAQTL